MKPSYYTPEDAYTHQQIYKDSYTFLKSWH